MTEDHRGRRLDLSASEFRALFDAVSTWGRWGERDQDGALQRVVTQTVAQQVLEAKAQEAGTTAAALTTLRCGREQQLVD